MLANQSASRCLHRKHVSVGMLLDACRHPGTPAVRRATSALELCYASFSADGKHIWQILQRARSTATQLQRLCFQVEGRAREIWLGKQRGGGPAVCAHLGVRT